MATGLYALARQSFLTAGINMNGSSNGLLVSLVQTTGGGAYTVNLTTDQYYNIIPSGAIAATAGSVLTGLSFTDGVFSASNFSFTSVSFGSACGALVLYYWTGTASTSPLIAYIDNYAGLPVTPNGGNINVLWPTGSNGIFKL